MPARAVSRLPLAERLRPTRLEEVVGNPRARTELRAWAVQWQGSRVPARRAAVLAGPPGVGKTTAALALAAELGWTLVEMNASDARNETAIEQVAGRASVSHTLGDTFGGKTTRHALILLDEADCLTGRLPDKSRPRPGPPPFPEFLRGRYGTVDALNTAWGLTAQGKPRAFEDWAALPRTPGNASWARLPAARRDIEEWRSIGRAPDLSDRGGLAAIARLVGTTRQPIVLTVNDERSLTRYSPIFRTKVQRIRFFPVHDAELADFVERVARSERITLYPGTLESIVHRAHGDVRAALNDLDAIAPLPSGAWQLSALGFRDLTADFIALTGEALSTPRYYRSVEVQDRLDATPDDLLPWIEENLPAFSPDAVHRDAAFRVLSVADQFLTRARRARVYGLWSYASELMTGGVSLALRDRPGGPGAPEAMFPRFLAEMGYSRGFRTTREGLAKKAGRRLHLSTAKSREVVLPFLQRIFTAAAGRGGRGELRRTAAEISRELELTVEEVAFLAGIEPGSRTATELQGGKPAATPTGDEDDEESLEDARRRSRETSGEPSKRVQRQLSDFGPG